MENVKLLSARLIVVLVASVFCAWLKIDIGNAITFLLILSGTSSTLWGRNVPKEILSNLF